MSHPDLLPQVQRRLWLLLTYSPATGAATAVVAVTGADTERVVISWLPQLSPAATAFWRDKLASTGQDDRARFVQAMDAFAAEANGITFDVVEVAGDLALTLQADVEAAVDTLAAPPGE